MTTVTAGAATDPGSISVVNEDRVHVDSERGIYLVVDGLGGHAAGDRAAEIAVNVIARELNSGPVNPAEDVRRAIALANNEIFRISKENPDCSGMGCVLTVAIIKD